VGWACSLYADMIGHWEKRNPQALENHNPANLNRELLVDLYRRYGGARVADRLEHGGEDPGRVGERAEGPGMRGEWGAGVRREEGGRRHPGAVRAALLLRLRGRRPDQCLGL